MPRRRDREAHVRFTASRLLVVIALILFVLASYFAHARFIPNGKSRKAAKR